MTTTTVSRWAMAMRLLRGADDLRSRVRLARYFVVNQLDRARSRPRADGSRLDLRIGGLRWVVDRSSSQLGGIHDVLLGQEYDAFPGFVARPGWVVVDIGANVGAYTLWQWRNMGGDGVLVAVEASPGTAAVLRRNLEANGAVVPVVDAAVWRSAGTVEFVVSDRSSSTAGVRSTLDLDLVRDARAVQVPAITLAELLGRAELDGRRVDVVKLDVEGAELVALEAADDDTLARIDRMVVEVDERTWEPLRALLGERGFHLVGRHRNVGYFARRAN